MNFTVKSVLLAIASVFAGAVAYAQVTTSSLTGRVDDENGEPLAGATVVAIHQPTGSQYYTVVNEAGRYTINGMRSGGPYLITYQFLGMADVEFNDITLKLGEPYEINTVLRSTNELNASKVVGESSFNASITGAGQSFSRTVVENAPTIDRSVYDVVKLTPQASVNKDGGISFAGSNNRYNSFQIDGAVSNDTFGLSGSGTNGGQTGANPISLDAIDEIQVVVAPFDVRQSGFTGGAINAVTKSGTNRFKGSAYGYFNNEDFIGTTPGNQEYLDKHTQGKRLKYDEQNSQTYGFTVGGPIVKNKLFFFVSAEYFRKSYPNVYSPSLGAYDKKTLKSAVNVDGGSYNILNPELADAMIKHYDSLLGITSGESYGPHQKTDRSINALARIDWNINDRNKFMLRYQFSDSYSDKYASGANTYYFNGSSYKMADRTNTIVGELNSRISDKVSNMLRVSSVFVRDHREVPYKAACMYIRDNITVDLGTEYSSGINSMNSDNYTLTDNLSLYLGNHEITLGTHNEFYKFSNGFQQAAFGEYVYASVKDFMENNPNQFVYKFSDPDVTGDPLWVADTYAAQFGAYLQDEWKPGRNFTLTYGIRADVPMFFNKPIVNEEFNASEFAIANNEYVGTVPKPSVMLSPRLGFRWFLDNDHRSLIRGGAGLFTGRVPFVWISNAYNNTGVATKSVTVDNPLDIDGWTAENMGKLISDPYNNIVKSGLSSKGKGALATINTINEKFKYPQVFRVNLGYEQIFGNNWKFTFDGLFSKTLNNVVFHNLALEKASSVNAVSPAVSAANPESVIPYFNLKSGYSAVIALGNTNQGYTYSVSGKLEKSFDFGLDLMASYTFGHAYAVNDGTSSVAASNWNNYVTTDPSADLLSYSVFDKPHKVMAVLSYTSPRYLEVLRTRISLVYNGESGNRYSYNMNEKDGYILNGDGRAGNTPIYVPTADEIGKMSWVDPADAVRFEKYIRNDAYLMSRRGKWSQLFGGRYPFENHFDLHIAEDIFNDLHGTKVEITFDIKNLSNLLCRSWGLYYPSTWNFNVLQVNSATVEADGSHTPNYVFKPYDMELVDFYSRWRCQVGLRVTF